LFCLSLFVCAQIQVCAQPSHHSQPEPSQPWQKYLAAGTTAEGKDDKEKAKAYYFASLTELEKTPFIAPHDRDFVILQSKLLHLYRPDKSRDSLSAKDKVKFRQEELALMDRLVHLNEKFGTTNSMVGQVVAHDHETAVKGLEKAKTDLQKQESPKPQ
jgi:hypothetical protein